VFTSKLPPALAERADEVVAAEATSRSALIRRALVLLLDGEDVDPLAKVGTEARHAVA
jgi:metal-responsive CopG/Arc/MetJ family transcriptional regulator